MSILRAHVLSILALLCLSVANVPGQTREGGRATPGFQLYTYSRFTNELCTVNTMTGQVDSKIRLSIAGVWMLAYHWQHDLFYALYSIDPNQPLGPVALATVNRRTGEVSPIAQPWSKSDVGGLVNATDLACDPKTGALYVITDERSNNNGMIGRLCRIDPTTAELTQIGQVWTGGDHASGIPWPWVLTCDYQGNIFASNPSDGISLWEIDERTGSYGSPKHFSWMPKASRSLPEDFEGIAFEPGNAALFVIGDRFVYNSDFTAWLGSAFSLYVVDGKTGTISRIGDLVAPSAGFDRPFPFQGLAFAPHVAGWRD